EESTHAVRMAERWQGALRFCSDILRRSRPFVNDSGKELTLVGGPGEGEAAPLRASGDARPIHVCGNVRVADPVEWRIKISMLRAHLNGCLGFRLRFSVINRQDIAALQFRRYVLDPIQRGLIEFFRIMNRSLDKQQVLAIKID